MKQKKILSWILLGMIILPLFGQNVRAEDTCGKVVINEVAWAGSADSSNDEWIELYNGSCNSVDLSGWKIIDNASTYVIDAGTVESKGYFLVEDSEAVVKSLTADKVIGMSLSNSGEKLILKDASDAIVDSVNTAGGAWYAGDNTSKATMERVDHLRSGDDSTNWKSALGGNGNTSSNGSAIIGTPKGRNSVSYQEEEKAKITLLPNTANPAKNSQLSVEVKVSSIKNLFAYGVNIDYDKTVLDFDKTEQGTFLNGGEVAATSFQSGLENNQEGKLIVAEALTNNNITGETGSGLLFKVIFKVIGDAGSKTDIAFGSDSFTANATEDTFTEFSNITVNVTDEVNAPVAPTNFVGSEGGNLYSVKLTWEASTSTVDGYKILRKNQKGELEELAKLTALEYTDEKNIIPSVNYAYQIVSYKGDLVSQPVEITAKDSRGILGDGDRSKRVDGRDLEKLAKVFGESYGGSSYNPLFDFNYDGRIDGKDLIEMTSNWAKKI